LQRSKKLEFHVLEKIVAGPAPVRSDASAPGPFETILTKAIFFERGLIVGDRFLEFANPFANFRPIVIHPTVFERSYLSIARTRPSPPLFSQVRQARASAVINEGFNVLIPLEPTGVRYRNYSQLL
jgi:hypothetical protein